MPEALCADDPVPNGNTTELESTIGAGLGGESRSHHSDTDTRQRLTHLADDGAANGARLRVKRTRAAEQQGSEAEAGS